MKKIALIILFGLMFAVFGAANDGAERIVYDVIGKPVSLSFTDSIPTILVFAQNPSCHDCFLKLEKKLAELRKTMKFKVWLLICSTDNTTNRKLERKHFKDLLTCDSVFFNKRADNGSLADSSFFAYNQITATPSVLLHFKQKEILLRLDSLKSRNYGIIKDKLFEVTSEK